MVTKQEFLKGTIILATANIIVKLIGAFYTIPLARMMGPEGMGIYNSAYQIYMWLFMISTTGFPIAISKLVSENVALGRIRQAHTVFRVSLMMLLILGFLSSVVLFYFANQFVDIIGTSKSYYSLLAISPSLFFVSVMSAYRGYFQGLQDMIPTAISQLIEAIIKLIVGLLFAHALLMSGVEFSSAGALIGVSLGGLFGMIFLIAVYYYKRSQTLDKIHDRYTAKGNYNIRSIATKLINMALPITLGASIFSISSIIDLTMIMRRLREIGFSEENATKLYGYLTGYAYKIYILPSTVIIALTISLIPILSAAYVKNNPRQIKKIVNFALKCSLIFSIPSAIGLSILSDEILYLLFRDSNASQMLRILSIAIVLVTTVQVSSAVLQSTGKAMIPVRNLIIGAIIKIVLNYILIGIPSINILGAAISTIICYFVVTILNLIEVRKVLVIQIDVLKLFIKPIIASIGMVAIVLSLREYIIHITDSNSITIMISVFGGMIGYSILILLIGGIDKSELELISPENKITYYLKKFKIIK